MEPFVPRSRSSSPARCLYPCLHLIPILKLSSFAFTPGIRRIHSTMHLIELYCVVSFLLTLIVSSFYPCFFCHVYLLYRSWTGLKNGARWSDTIKS